MEANPAVVPQHIKARTPEELTARMLQQNLKDGWQHKYQIVFNGKLWFAWFYQNLSEDIPS